MSMDSEVKVNDLQEGTGEAQVDISSVKHPTTAKAIKENFGDKCKYSVKEVDGRIQIWKSESECIVMPNYEYYYINDKPIALSRFIVDRSEAVQTFLGTAILSELALRPQIEYRCFRYEIADGVEYYYMVDPFENESYTHIQVKLSWNREYGTCPLKFSSLKGLRHCRVSNIVEIPDDPYGVGGVQMFFVENNSSKTFYATQKYREHLMGMVKDSASYHADVEQNRQEYYKEIKSNVEILENHYSIVGTRCSRDEEVCVIPPDSSPIVMLANPAGVRMSDYLVRKHVHKML